MRLINVASRQLEEFTSEIPPYAILSHRWGSQELNFKEVFKLRIDFNKQGYEKLVQACKTAASHQLGYLWIDTCCIDKRSSAELTEAINSMFAWYQNAQVCLAYLEDVRSAEVDESFAHSVWFTRAWTLQELLAPSEVVFYNGDWQRIATKQSAAAMIKRITGIPDTALSDPTLLWEFNIAERMSWASGRQATRTEDIAYSLMGLFNVYMPLLYGEGTRAFVRLQEEIVRNSDTLAFLLWGLQQPTLSLLASSPADFDFIRDATAVNFDPGQSLNMTNLGLEVEDELYLCAVGVYGIVVAGAADEDQTYLLLLRKRTGERNLFYKFCLVVMSDMWRQRNCHVRKRFTILKGTKEQKIDHEGGWQLTQGLDLVGQPIPVHVYAESPLSVRSMLDVNDSGISLDNGDQRDSNRSETPMIFWLTPMKAGVVKLVCRSGNRLSLWMEFCFDVGSYPCLLVRRHDEKENPGHSKRGRLFILGVIQDHTDRSKTKRVHGSWIELRPEKIAPEGGMEHFFIRGAEHRPCSVMLSGGQVPKDEAVWASFFGVNDAWVISISRMAFRDPTHSVSTRAAISY